MESELAEHLAPAFLAQVPAEALNQTLAAIKDLRLLGLTVAHANALYARVETGGTPYILELSVDATGRITGARLSAPPTPQPTPASWKELDERLRKAAPQVGFLAAEVTRGDCRPVHGVAAGEKRPLGSMVKLYVLGTVAERIQERRVRLGHQAHDHARAEEPADRAAPGPAGRQRGDRPGGRQTDDLHQRQHRHRPADPQGGQEGGRADDARLDPLGRPAQRAAAQHARVVRAQGRRPSAAGRALPVA